MSSDGFWGTTSPAVVYDASVLLALIHEYFGVDRDSEAFKLLHELFMSTGDCPVHAVLESAFP